MGMSIQLELTDEDLSYFHAVLDKAKNTAAIGDEKTVILKAEQLLDEVESQEKFPLFVEERFQYLHTLIAMLKDDEWNVPSEEKKEILNVLSYFLDSYDLIADDIPGIGYLDDAIMISLVVEDITKELKNYSQFQHFSDIEKVVGHDSNVTRADWEEHNRVAMFQRMRNRRGTTGSIL